MAKAVQTTTSKPKAKQDALSRCEEGLALISDGLDILEGCALLGLSSARSIDITARLNTQSLAIEKMVLPLKDQIKTQALSDNAGSNSDSFIVKGVVYQAVIKRVVKTVVVMEKVRAFLGKRLYQFQDNREEIQVSFGVKE